MSRSFTTRRWFGVRSILVLGIGVLMLAVAVAQKPVDPVGDEVICLYFDELARTDSDYLVVAVLEGSLNTKNLPKEGQVISMFPPTNDGTRPKDTGGTGSGDAKSGAVDHNSARSNKGGIRDTGGGTGSGDAKSGAVDHNISRSNKGTKTGTGGDTDLGDTNLSEADVRECEHCGASCTEPCRCNPTGFELIFGNTDDELVDMQIESDYLHLLFVTCYGMRSVTLYPMEADSNQTLVIAKGWRDHGLTVCPRADESTDGKNDLSSDLSSKHQDAVEIVGNSRPIEASADAPGIIILHGGGNGCLQ